MQLAALAAGAVLAYIIWLVMQTGESGNSPTVEVHVSDSTKAASKDPREDKTKADPNQVSESKHLIPGSGQKTYYEIVGQSTERLEMDESLAIHRVRRGLGCLQRGTFVTEAKRMSDLGEAYKHLINNEVFMDSKFPIWGKDSEGYFAFSGYPNCDQKAAFRSGYAVKKNDGRVFKWWLQDDE